MALRHARPSGAGPLRLAMVAVVAVAALLAGVLVPQQILAARRAASAAPAPLLRSAQSSGCCVRTRRVAGHGVAWHANPQLAPR